MAMPTRKHIPSLPFLRTKLARLQLIAHYVELMRDGQIKALPRELVTPVSLLMKETCVLHLGTPRRPRARNDIEQVLVQIGRRALSFASCGLGSSWG